MKREKGSNFFRQSYAGAIRQRLLHIERKIAFGSKPEELRKELAKAGFEAAPGTFRKSLWRARRWWRIQLQVNSPNLQARLAMSTEPNTPALPHSSPSTPTTQEPQSKSTPQLPAATKTSPISSPRIKRDDLDQFFQRKSVFTKP